MPLKNHTGYLKKWRKKSKYVLEEHDSIVQCLHVTSHFARLKINFNVILIVRAGAAWLDSVQSAWFLHWL
jgi:hypothetical protein